MKKKKAGGVRDNLQGIMRFISQRSIQMPVAVCLIFIIYIFCSFAVNHYRPVYTEPAVQTTLDDAITVSGYFIRQEQVINVRDVRTARYNFLDGDKVAVGSPLVTVYKNDRTLKASQKLDEVQSTISQLETLQSNSYITNTSQIDQKLTSQMNTVSDLVDSASFSQIAPSMELLRSYSLKSGTMDGEIGDIDSRLKKLKKARKKLEKDIEGKTTQITSDYSGYFCQNVDGYENILTTDNIDDLTPSSFKKLTVKTPAGVRGDDCKIISSYTWYYAALMSKTDAQRLKKDQEVTLRFAQPSDNISASVYAVRDEKNSDNILVLFQSDDMNDEMVSMRKEVGDVVIASYKGLKVPKDAIHMKGSQMGVYIMNDKVASFKLVEPVYEGDDFYIVKQNVIGDDSLVVHDDIIVHAKDVDDKKVIK